MRTEDIEKQARIENIERYIRHGCVWALLIVSLLMLFVTSKDAYWSRLVFLSPIFINDLTGSSIGFAISSGLFVSSIFTFMLVIYPNTRRKRSTKDALLHIPSFILEGAEGGLFTWSKNVIFCNTDKCVLENILDYKQRVEGKAFNDDQINITLQHASETLHLFENSLPAAMSISSTHGFFWIGMTSSMKKLSDVHSEYDFSYDEQRKSSVELYYLYGFEFVKFLESFVRLKI